MDLIRCIHAAGIVGCGGAGFPTDQKLCGKFRYLIANGAECEPLLRTDRYLMREKAPEIVRIMAALAEFLQVECCVIALKDHYHAELAALRKAVAESGADVKIFELQNFYPAGDEQMIVREVTGRNCSAHQNPRGGRRSGRQYRHHLRHRRGNGGQDLHAQVPDRDRRGCAPLLSSASRSAPACRRALILPAAQRAAIPTL